MKNNSVDPNVFSFEGKFQKSIQEILKELDQVGVFEGTYFYPEGRENLVIKAKLSHSLS